MPLNACRGGERGGSWYAQPMVIAICILSGLASCIIYTHINFYAEMHQNALQDHAKHKARAELFQRDAIVLSQLPSETFVNYRIVRVLIAAICYLLASSSICLSLPKESSDF
jgi:hypothetical protein